MYRIKLMALLIILLLVSCKNDSSALDGLNTASDVNNSSLSDINGSTSLLINDESTSSIEQQEYSDPETDNSGTTESETLRIDQMEDQGLLSVEDAIMLSNGLHTIGATEVTVGDSYLGMVVKDVEIFRARSQEQKDMLKRASDLDIEITKAQVGFSGEFTISGIYDATSEGFRYFTLDDVAKESIPYFAELSELWPLTEIHFTNPEIINNSILEGKKYLNCKVIAKDLILVYVVGGSPRNYATFLDVIEYGQAEEQ